jgi:hypothetical protein
VLARVSTAVDFAKLSRFERKPPADLTIIVFVTAAHFVSAPPLKPTSGIVNVHPPANNPLVSAHGCVDAEEVIVRNFHFGRNVVGKMRKLALELRIPTKVSAAEYTQTQTKGRRKVRRKIGAALSVDVDSIAIARLKRVIANDFLKSCHIDLPDETTLRDG